MDIVNNKLNIRISDNFLNWYANPQTFKLCDKDKRQEAYRMWEHCDQILQKKSITQYELTDCMLTLRRVVAQRVKLMDEIYIFQKIPIKVKPKKLYEQLEYFGLIRPYMLRKLIDFRNLLEHEFKKPPTQERCFEFLDIVWYFLKSTDGCVDKCLEEVVFECKEARFLKNEYWCTVSLIPAKNWLLEISGWFPAEYLIEDDKKSGGVLINGKQFRDKKTELKRLKNPLHVQNKRSKDFWLVGTILSCPEATYSTLFRIYFSL